MAAFTLAPKRASGKQVAPARPGPWPIQAVRANELRRKSAATLLAEAENMARLPLTLRPLAWVYLAALALEGLERAAVLEACESATPADCEVA